MIEVKKQLDPQLRKIIKGKAAIIPVGSIEQHGPHLPVSTDSDIVTEVAKRIAKKRDWLLLPTITYGVSFEHAPFFNLSIRESTLRTILVDISSSLLANGIKIVFIINGHHGNMGAIRNIDKKISAMTKNKLKVFSFSYWHFMKREFDHAGDVETSLMLAISKDVKMKYAEKGLVIDGMTRKQIKDLGKLAAKSFPKVTKNGVWGNPINATKKKGDAILAEIVRNLDKMCQTCLTGHSPKLHQ